MRRPIQPIPRRPPGGAQRAELKRILNIAYNRGVETYDRHGPLARYESLCPYPTALTTRKQREQWFTGYLERKEEMEGWMRSHEESP